MNEPAYAPKAESTVKQTPENNLYLWWQARTPQERAEHRNRLDHSEITELLTNIREDCKLFLAEVEAARGSNGSKPPKDKKEEKKLEQAWDKLSPEQREALEQQFNPDDSKDAGDDPPRD